MPTQLARRARYAAAWLPRLPGDAWRASHYHLPGGYRRVYHYHVPKTGGTSLHRSFLALGGEDPSAVHHRVFTPPTATRSGPYVFVEGDPRAIARGHWFFAWSHEPAWFLRLPPQTFTVTVLRDPLARLLSLYRYLSDARADEDMPAPADDVARGYAERGFADFVRRFPANELHKPLDLFSQSHDPAEAADRVRRCSLWFFHEHYDEGLAALGRRLELPLTAQRARISASSDRPGADELEVGRQALAAEYEMLEHLRRDPGEGLVGSVPAPP